MSYTSLSRVTGSLLLHYESARETWGNVSAWGRIGVSVVGH
jgi:hypothetical protein